MTARNNKTHDLREACVKQALAIIAGLNLLVMVLEIAHAPRKIHETNWREFVKLENEDLVLTSSTNDIKMESLKSQLEIQQKQLDYYTITAPFDGVVTARLVHPGALVGPIAASSAMLRLEQNSRLRLVVAVPEAAVSGIVNGARVPFTVPAYPGEIFSGVVVRIAHSLDLKTRTMPVELDLSNPNLRLFAISRSFSGPSPTKTNHSAEYEPGWISSPGCSPIANSSSASADWT